uniref:Small G protein signaling modulator 1b n=1 Tax=Esox lucius TaxID=8010 RepID=A0A6Q2XWR3_ESOLU
AQSLPSSAYFSALNCCLLVSPNVKQIMEEAVTRKFVHADSSHIISFCAVVEACVLHGLKRRAAGLLCSNKVAALFMKVGKSFTPAEELCQKVHELEQLIETNRQAQLNNGSVQKQPRMTNLPPQGLKNLWIRTALMEKLLDKIVLYLVENSSTFYDREAILMDPVDGPILASLLVGPCALEYTKVKTADHFWTDPSADELVQRHRIHSGHCRQDSPSRRPALVSIQKRQSSGSMEDRPILWARDYVESLHQNNRATLLFGKNNVLVQPRDDMEAIPGYLSLHQTADLMTLKWTPNQLMNGTLADDTEKSVYWNFAMTIRLEEIVYLHCHQQVDSGGTVVLVSQDGIQRPPLRFPRGGHLLQFLTCLETGLLPHGQLDPPLWSQRGKGKVFPKLRKRSPQGSVESVSDKEEDEATDFVFRILLPGTPSDFGRLRMNSLYMWHPTPRKSSCFSCSQSGSPDGSLPNGCNQDRAPLKRLCDTMKYQIISRAFYGWLAYCRHLSTVRIHLSALVNPAIVDPDLPHDARGGLTVDIWSSFLHDFSAYDEHELLRLVYYGGVAPALRKEVWPFLLGHYHFDMTAKRRIEVDEQVRACYEQTMKEWLGCEAIVKQSERKKHAEAIAKCNSVASLNRPEPVQRDSTVSTDSSQSVASDKPNIHSQSYCSLTTQVQYAFWSMEEMEQIESETKPGESKDRSKTKGVQDVSILNGTSDSGDPSTCNISVNSGLSEQQHSTNHSPVSDSPVRTTATLSSPKSSPTQGATCNPQARADTRIVQTVLETEGETKGFKLPIPIDDKAASTGESKAPENEKISKSVEIMKTSEQAEEKGSDKDDVQSLGNVETERKKPEQLDLYLLNVHRIDKDVRRCDRTYWYFTPGNLEKLRNIMCSYVWQHLEIGYVQGMCDLLAPLLVVLDDEVMAFSCFSELMKRMNQNFPHGGAMDSHFANMRSLIQILDSELFELMQMNGDYTHFYFCYRWFLLDFKREMVYDDVFSVWETIWAATYTSSTHFVLFIALAMVEMYRDIILENNMDFTDIIKFFNEMAEHHNVPQVLMMARDLVLKVQTLIENK